MDNDLNTAQAVTVIYDVLKYKTNDATKLALLDDFDKVLGLDMTKKASALRQAQEASKASAAQGSSDYVIEGEGDPEIDALVLKRYEAKKAKDFTEADRIRDELTAMGIEVRDVRGGAVWKKL